MALGERQQELHDVRELLRGLQNERESLVRLRSLPEIHEENLRDLRRRRDHYQRLIDETEARWSGADDRLTELGERINELQLLVQRLKYRKELEKLQKLERKFRELADGSHE